MYPGRGTDDDEDFTDWDIEQLKDRVKLVQDLDRLADAMVQQAVDLTKNYEVQVEEYFVPQSRKVLKALLTPYGENILRSCPNSQLRTKRKEICNAMPI